MSTISVFVFIVMSIAAEISGQNLLVAGECSKWKLKKIENTLDDLQNELKKEISGLKSINVHISKAVESNKDKIQQLERENWAIRTNQDGQRSRLETAKKSYFVVSDPFQGKRYLLTREASFFYPSFGMSLCALFGGYLAEIDTSAEFDYVKNFIQTSGSKFSNIMAGGTDETQPGRWINRYSHTPVASFWQPGEPNNYRGIQHCQVFSRMYNWKMDDHQCQFTGDTGVGFVCEVTQ